MSATASSEAVSVSMRNVLDKVVKKDKTDSIRFVSR
jgi:hypothetical protein